MTAGVEDRLGERHFPWHYTEFGVVCACGRPCDSNEACAVVRRVRAIFPPGSTGGGDHSPLCPEAPSPGGRAAGYIPVPVGAGDCLCGPKEADGVDT